MECIDDRIDMSTAPRRDFPSELESDKGIELRIVEDVITKTKKVVYRSKYLNGKECETLIIDKGKEIALSLLDEFGWKDNPHKDEMSELMALEAKWESDLAETKLLMMTLFIREKDKFAELGKIKDK